MKTPDPESCILVLYRKRLSTAKNSHCHFFTQLCSFYLTGSSGPSCSNLIMLNPFVIPLNYSNTSFLQKYRKALFLGDIKDSLSITLDHYYLAIYCSLWDLVSFFHILNPRNKKCSHLHWWCSSTWFVLLNYFS